MLLFFMGFPDLDVDILDESEVEAHDCNNGVSPNNRPLSRDYHSVNVPKRR